MAMTKMSAFTFLHSSQIDALYTVYTATQIKTFFDSQGSELKTYLNNILTEEIDVNLATKAELAGIVLGEIPDASLTAVKFAPNALQADNTQLSTATATAYSLTEVDTVLKELSNKIELNTLPLNLFYNGTVHDIAGAFIYDNATAVDDVNLYAFLQGSPYYYTSKTLYMVKPIYIDKYESTAKIEITYTLASGFTDVNATLGFNVVGGSGSTSVDMPITLTPSTVSLPLNELSYLDGTTTPLYLYFPLFASEDTGNVILTISKIELKNS